jgi:hypothetical protein
MQYPSSRSLSQQQRRLSDRSLLSSTVALTQKVVYCGFCLYKHDGWRTVLRCWRTRLWMPRYIVRNWLPVDSDVDNRSAVFSNGEVAVRILGLSSARVPPSARALSVTASSLRSAWQHVCTRFRPKCMSRGILLLFPAPS